MEHPLRPLVDAWRKKIELAMQHKKKKFQDLADEAMSFFNGPYDFMYAVAGARGSRGFKYTGEEDLPRPSFCMTVNKVAEIVQLFGPSLYHRNPVRKVNPRQSPTVPPELFMGMAQQQLAQTTDPMQAQMLQMQLQMQMQQFQQMQAEVQQRQVVDQARADLLSSYLNYTPTALNLKDECRAMIDEALIKGMGVLWTELYQPVGSETKMVGSFYDSVNNLCIDPDLGGLREAKWIARRCVHPVWEVEQMYGLKPGSIQGTLESLETQVAVDLDDAGDYKRARGETNDLLVYWKVFSKMGMGTRLKGAGQSAMDAEMREQLNLLGDYCYLVVCDKAPYFLNLGPDLLAEATTEQVQEQVQWPTPFWADDAWPMTPLAFHPIPDEVWPMSHLSPGLGELKFINWAFSFLAGKIRVASRDFLAVMKSAGEELKTKILHGQDYELLEMESVHGGTISNVVQFLQHPPFQGDIYRVLEAVIEQFEKRVGLTELMYGMSSRQYRSASEAQVKAEQTQIRPDDMANKVEDAMTEVARKEALAARWHLGQEDVETVMGPVGAYWWTQLVQSADPNAILHQLEYRIEAGSAKKPNKAKEQEDANTAMQMVFQPLWQYAMQTGNTGPVNALLTQWARANDMDVDAILVPPMQLPPPPGAGGEPPEGEQAA